MQKTEHKTLHSSLPNGETEEAFILSHSILASKRLLNEQIPESDELLVVKLLYK